MFKKVLLSLDFSVSSQKILNRIREIPGIKEVVLLHVVDATRPLGLEWKNGHPQLKNTELLIAEKKEYLENLGLKVNTQMDVIVSAITQGTVAHAILETAETENVSLIILGARGINPIQALLLGSVSSSVLRYAKTNVLIMHFKPADDSTQASSGPVHQDLFSKVLVPTDFSRSAINASDFIKKIPGIQEIIFLHVVNHVASHQDIEVYQKEAQARLEDMKQEYINTGVKIKYHVLEGDPTEIILSIAEEDDVSLIAMSAHGTDWLREMILGSTTFTVVRRTQKPVLVIRTEQENPPS
ncbi:MAG: universal stress protein [Methanoregula sp.]|jgi:nucleotide-binding universal stress UspA family protein|nr:universal stress protein [Methanoregula sp.]